MPHFKANILKTFGWMQLARACFLGQIPLRNKRHTQPYWPTALCCWRAIEWNIFCFCFFFYFHKLCCFRQRSRDMLQQALVWLWHWKRKNSRTKSASLFFSSGLSLCSPNLAGCTVCVRVCVCPHAHGGTCTSLALSGVCISHQLVLMAGSQPCW